jgi:hypothetical protein
MALLDLASAIFIGTKGREHVSRPEVKRLIPFMFVGFIIGRPFSSAFPTGICAWPSASSRPSSESTAS